ncbi:MAG: gliding motility-associated C-terminal domain-containing protein [Chitinophaga sp.]|uniref:gliding motility-associated C-terminal domain-containing protein n=1 Tax=Chitinophaga sp. TaxID=1869181 RepID=UPI0025BF9B80|nr:gliding motility-associated C-terminal domain-containing protein [Chitinophaga sp.]MBV8254859.1 gliding motility-associated C-terminal domain-containing protein [Chitinophaga sp.]
MHSKATPTSPFSASFVILRARDGSLPKPRKSPRFVNWWKCIISALILIACYGTNVNAQTYYQRVYANSQANAAALTCLACGVTNPQFAVDAPPAGLSTASTLRSDVGLLSFVYQDLIFPAPIPVTQGVILKIGTGNVVSVTLATITAQPMSGGTNVGSATSLNSALATLLVSNSASEIYVPAPGGSGTYDRVRVQIGGLATVATTLQIYAAYYNIPATTSLACDQPIDAYGGPKSFINIASLVNLGTVDNPGNAIDGDTTTFATLSTLAGVAGYTRLDAVFPGLSKTGDSVRIILGDANGILSGTVLSNVTFLTYNGNTVVDSIPGNSNVLNLGLLSGPGSKSYVTFASSGPFDHVEVREGSIANVISNLNVYEIRRYIPSPTVSGSAANLSTCLNTPATFSVQNPDATLKYTWFNGTGGVVQGPASTSTYSPPVNVAGSFNYSVTASRTLCTTSSQPTPLNLLVKAYTTAADINFPDTAYSCMGDTVRITPYSTTMNKPVFSWWQDAAKTTPITNGLVVAGTKFLVDPTTGKLTIIGLPAGTNHYYVSASDSTHCDNLANTLKQVTVLTTTKAPVPTLGASTVYGSVNQPVTLLATPPGGGTVYWYSDTTLAPIGTGDTLTVGGFSTPSTHIYYAAVRLSASGACESYRVADTVIILPPVNTACNAPSSTTTGTTLGCVLCSVTNPNNAIDTTASTFSTLNIPVGLLGGSVYQQVIFPTLGAPTDSLRLTFGYNGSLANVGLLGGVEITVANGTNVIARDTLSKLVTLNLLSNPSQFTVTIPTGAAYNTVQVRLTGVANLLNHINFYGVRAVAPNPTFTNSSTCVGSRDTITASGLGANTLKWYTDSTTSVTAGTGTPFITPVLTTPGLITYYAQVTAADGCPNPDRIPVQVNVVNTPASPVVPGTIVVNTGQTASLTAAPVAGVTVNWYTDSITATPVGSGSPVVVGPFNTPGTYKYWASASANGATCSSGRVPVTIVVTGPVVPPTACNYATSQVSGTTLGCILCSVQNPTFSVDSSTTNYTTLAMPVGLLGGSIYQQLIFPNTGSATDSIQVTLGSSVNLADVSLLAGTVLTVYNGTTRVSADTLNNLVNLRLLNNGQQIVATIPTGAPYDRVEVRLTGLANLITSINIYGARVLYPNPTINTPNDTVCVNNPATLTVTPVAGTSVHWYADSTSTTVLSSSNTYTTDTLRTPGTVTYWLAVYGGPQNCENPTRIPVKVYVRQQGAPSDINLADTTTACTTGNAVLAPTANPASGIINPVFSWYFDAAKTQPITNATVSGVTYNIDSTGKLTITGLAAGTHTYYVAIAGSNRCQNVAGNLKPAVVNVVTVPAPPVVPGTIVVNTGQTATLTATPVPGATINWYTDSTGNNLVGSGASVVVGPFNTPGTYTYYAGVSLPGGCKSRLVAVSVVVAGPVAPPTACNYATSQVSGTTLGCILCSVQNPTFSVDSSTTNYTTLTMPVGLLGGSIYQQLIFPNAGSATDSIRVTLGSSVNLADVSLLAGTVLTVYNGTTKVSADTLSNLATLRLLNNGQQIVATIPTGGTYDRVEVRMTGLANLINSINIYGARIMYPNPTINTPNDTVCAYTKATLTVTPVAGTGVHWYADSTSTTVLSSNSTYITDTLKVPGTITYWVAVFGGPQNCENPYRIPVKVVVLSTPIVVADSTNPSTICVSNLPATLKVVAQPGVTYTWYGASGNVLLANSNVYTTSNTMAVGQYTFYVQGNNANGCSNANARTPIKLNVISSAMPSDINIDTVQNICLGDTVRLVPTSTTITNPVFLWYADQQKTTPITTGVNPTTGVLTIPNLATGTYNYYVSVSSNGNCANAAGNLKHVTVNIGRKATAADIQVTGNTTTCVNSTTTLTASSTTVTNPTFKWYRDAGLTQFIRSTSTFVTDTLTATTTYYVTVQGVNACENAPGAAKPVTVTVNNSFITPTVTGAAICSGQTAVVKVLNPDPTVTYNWYNSPSLSLFLAAADSFKTGPLTGDTTLYLQASRGGCTSTFVAATITVNSVANPVVDANQPVCAGSGGTLVVKSPVSGVVYRWFNVPTGGTALNTDAGTTFSTGPLTTSTIFYVQAVGTAGCTGTSGRVPVTAVITALPNAPTLVTNNQTICAGGNVTFTIANPDPSLTYHWFTAAVNGTEVPATTPTTLTVNNVTATTTYYVSAVNAAGCSNTGSRTAATVNVNPAPTAPVVTIPNEVVCLNNSATFQVTNPDPALTYIWYNATTDSVGTGASFTTPVLTTTTNYYVVAKNNTGCFSLAHTNVSATVTNSIATPSVGANQNLCLGQTLTLSVNNPVAGIVYHWYTTATGGTPIATGSTVTFNGVTTNTTYYVDASATSGNCTSSTRASVAVTVSNVPGTPAVANATPTTCLNSMITLAVQNADPTLTYNWYTVQTGGTPVATGASVNVGPITTNTNYYVAAVNASGCASAQRTLVSVTASTAPAAPQVSGNGQAQCPGSSYILTATSTTPGASFAWYTTATGGTPISQTSIFTTPAINQNTTYYVEASINGGCVSATRTAVPITVLSALTAPVVTVTNKTATSITFTWVAVPGATQYAVSVGDSTHFVAPSSGANGLSHTVTNLQPNQNVTIYVKAIGVGTCQNSLLTAVTDKTTNPNGNNCYVPNLFSPNGDGINDIEYVYGTAIAQLEFRIYNQWGQLVFESRDQRQGWDGTMNGVKQPVGVYVYILKATMQDGTVVTKKGNVTLMR